MKYKAEFDNGETHYFNWPDGMKISIVTEHVQLELSSQQEGIITRIAFKGWTSTQRKTFNTWTFNKSFYVQMTLYKKLFSNLILLVDPERDPGNRRHNYQNEVSADWWKVLCPHSKLFETLNYRTMPNGKETTVLCLECNMWIRIQKPLFPSHYFAW